MSSEVQLRRPRPDQRPHSDTCLSGLNRDIVRLYAHRLGRGPTKARSFLYEDHCLCTLGHVLTRAEETLVAAGCVDQVRENRRNLHATIEEDLSRVVEEHTGRRVCLCLGQIDPATGLAIEFFAFVSGRAADRNG